VLSSSVIRVPASISLGFIVRATCGFSSACTFDRDAKGLTFEDSLVYGGCESCSAAKQLRPAPRVEG